MLTKSWARAGAVQIEAAAAARVIVVRTERIMR
jgi:hypothetical protein